MRERERELCHKARRAVMESWGISMMIPSHMILTGKDTAVSCAASCISGRLEEAREAIEELEKMLKEEWEREKEREEKEKQITD